jgi:hypothetical protein
MIILVRYPARIVSRTGCDKQQVMRPNLFDFCTGKNLKTRFVKLVSICFPACALNDIYNRNHCFGSVFSWFCITGSGLGLGIQIRVQEGNNDPQRHEKAKKFHVLIAECSLWGGGGGLGGFSCRLKSPSWRPTNKNNAFFNQKFSFQL